MDQPNKIEFQKLRRVTSTFDQEQERIVPLNQQRLKNPQVNLNSQIALKQNEYKEFLELAKKTKNLCWGIIIPKSRTTNFGCFPLTNNEKKNKKKMKTHQFNSLPFSQKQETKSQPTDTQRNRNFNSNRYEPQSQFLDQTSQRNQRNSRSDQEDDYFKIGLIFDGEYRYVISKAQLKDLLKTLNKNCQNWTYDLAGILRQFEVDEFPDFVRQSQDLKIACWLLDPEIKKWDLSLLQKQFCSSNPPQKQKQKQKNKQKQDLNENSTLATEIDPNQTCNTYYHTNSNLFNYQQFGCDLTSLNTQEKVARILHRSFFKKLHSFRQVMGEVIQELAKRSLLTIYTNVESPLCHILSKMEHQGILFDRKAAQKQMFVLSGLMGQLQIKIKKLVGPFNLNSPEQLSKIIYDKLKLLPRHYGHDKKGAMQLRSTKESVLIRMVDDHPIIPLILEFRKKSKSFASLKTLLTIFREHPKCQTSGKMYGMWSQINSSLGKLTSENAGLLTIPAEHRKLFKADEGHSLISADYSTLELRIVTHLSGDQKLIQILSRSEMDPMKYLASLILNKDVSQISRQNRKDTKILLYGTTYGMGPNKIAAQMKIQTSQAMGLQKRLYKLFPNLCLFTNKIKKRIEETNYAETLLGRRRYLNFIKDKNLQKKAKDQRIGVNTTIQGTSADLMRIAFVSLHDTIQNSNLKEKLDIILQIHDEFVLQVHDDYIQEALQLIKRNLENIVNISVPFPINMRVGKDWGQLEKLI
ncbi:DNA polymerase theta [Anaeramoeba flamelloides]|uniref:DNA polymerase theta n=1 Tax=Anaeramoeba flamelloides TaxID=1746091 RepID=A0ABQ8YDL6_9EUKA|nr:DNA polymerase theta [Anaeramoeba flamelloides]